MGPSWSTGTVDAALCTDHSCTSLGKNAPGFTALWASQELTDIQGGKLIAFILAGYTQQVLPDHLPIHCSVSIIFLWLISFSTSSTKIPHFGLTARQQINHDPSGCGMETCSPKS